MRWKSRPSAPTSWAGPRRSTGPTAVSRSGAAAIWSSSRRSGGCCGGGAAPAYNASKAYQINYAEGLRQRAAKSGLPLPVTDIRPGFVATEMAKGEGLFWVMPVDRVVEGIVRAIRPPP